MYSLSVLILKDHTIKESTFADKECAKYIKATSNHSSASNIKTVILINTEFCSHNMIPTCHPLVLVYLLEFQIIIRNSNSKMTWFFLIYMSFSWIRLNCYLTKLINSINKKFNKKNNIEVHHMICKL